jgi:ParB family chromosome partitioning protein
MMEIQQIAVDQLHESKTNPRTMFDKTSLKELTGSIKEKGILLPLLVRSNNEGQEVVSGARRLRAAKAAGLKEVPCIIKSLSDDEVLEIQLVENCQREDLHSLDEAESYQRLQKQFGYSIDQLATKTGKTDWHVQTRLKFCDLIEPVKKLFRSFEISQSHALQVARLLPEQQKECVQWLKNGWSARQLAQEIDRQFFLNLAEAPFDTKDAKLVEKAGSCLACPKRTGANKLLFFDIKDADTCTDPDCFENKVRAFVKIQVATHPDAVLLTAGEDFTPGWKPKGITEWTLSDDKTCADLKEGIVVEKGRGTFDHSIHDVKLGQTLVVCVNPKCKTHNKKEVSDIESGHSKKGLKARKIELLRRALIFKELAAEEFEIKPADYREILDWRIRDLSTDHARSVCNAMGWEAKKAQYGGNDFGATIAKNLAKLTTKGVEQWLFLLTLAERELWFYAGSTAKAELLEAKAKAVKIPLAEIAKQATQKKLKEAKPKKAAAAKA